MSIGYALAMIAVARGIDADSNGVCVTPLRTGESRCFFLPSVDGKPSMQRCVLFSLPSAEGWGQRCKRGQGTDGSFPLLTPQTPPSFGRDSLRSRV